MAQIKKKVRILEKQTPNKSKWWLWLSLLAVMGVAVIFFVKNHSSSGTDTAVQPEKIAIEQPVTTVDVEANNTDTTITKGAVAPKETPMTAEEATSSVAKTEQASAPTNKPVSTSAQSDQSVTKSGESNPVSDQTQGTLEEKAKRVIRGDFGNGIDRKQALGNEYNAIQQKVNEMHNNGIF